MISEFIGLDYVDSKDNTVKYNCSLPDPDLDDDKTMVTCGEIICTIDKESNCTNLNLHLFKVFEKLCIMDVYQRKNFIETIKDLLILDKDYRFHNTHVDIIDCWGTYSGDLDSVDQINRSVSEND